MFDFLLDEPTLQVERASFDGAIVLGIAYGINCAIVAILAPQLATQKRGNIVVARAFLVVLLLLFILATILLVGNTVLAEQTFVEYPKVSPSSPENVASSPKMAALVALVILVWVNVGLLMYRCLALYAFKGYLLLGQGIVFLCIIIAGSFTLYQLFHPSVPIFANANVELILPFTVIGITTDFILSCLIVGRLYYFQRISGVNSHGKWSPNKAVQIWIESFVLSGGFGIVFIATYLAKSPSSQLFLVLLGQVKMIASALVMLRVANGRREYITQGGCTGETNSKTLLRSPA